MAIYHDGDNSYYVPDVPMPDINDYRRQPGTSQWTAADSERSIREYQAALAAHFAGEPVDENYTQGRSIWISDQPIPGGIDGASISGHQPSGWESWRLGDFYTYQEKPIRTLQDAIDNFQYQHARMADQTLDRRWRDPTAISAAQYVVDTYNRATGDNLTVDDMPDDSHQLYHQSQRARSGTTGGVLSQAPGFQMVLGPLIGGVVSDLVSGLSGVDSAYDVGQNLVNNFDAGTGLSGIDSAYDVGQNLVNNFDAGTSLSGIDPAYDVGQNLVNNFDAGTSLVDAPYDVGENLVNNFNTTGSSTVPQYSPTTPGGGFNMDYFTNTPASTIAQRLTDMGIDAARAAEIANTVTGTGASTVARTAVGRILSNDGSATLDDYIRTLGTIGGTIGSVITGNERADSLQRLYEQNMAIGAPSRARYEASYAPGFDLAAVDPAYQGALDQSMNAYLRRASTGGNPFSNPGVSMEANRYVTQNTALPWLQNYRNQNASSGGMSAFSTAAPASGQTAATNQGQGLTNLFGGISDLLNPQQRGGVENWLRQYAGAPRQNNGLGTI